MKKATQRQYIVPPVSLDHDFARALITSLQEFAAIIQHPEQYRQEVRSYAAFAALRAAHHISKHTSQ